MSSEVRFGYQNRPSLAFVPGLTSKAMCFFRNPRLTEVGPSLLEVAIPHSFSVAFFWRSQRLEDEAGARMKKPNELPVRILFLNIEFIESLESP